MSLLDRIPQQPVDAATPPSPAPQAIDVESAVDEQVSTAASTLRFTWESGQVTRLASRSLRQVCPCAMCVDEFTGKRLLDPQSISVDVHPVGWNLVGNYALKVDWSDGHSTGIYTWKLLLSLSGKN